MHRNKPKKRNDGRALRAAAIETLENRRLLSAALIADVNTDPASSNPTGLTWAQDKLFFVASSRDEGQELWVADANGARLVKDINPGPNGGVFGWIVAVGGSVYFSASDPSGGQELWKSDGTAAGTVRVKDITPGTGSTSFGGMANVGGQLLFFVNPSFNGGYDLWKSDGTDAGTVKLQAHWKTGPSEMVVVGNTLYFNPTEPTYAKELWKSDGTDAGTTIVKDIAPGAEYGSPDMLTAGNGVIYFRANNALWRSDGTDAGTVMLKSWGASWPTDIETVGDKVFVSAADNLVGRELWVSDGTAAGTTLVKDIFFGSQSSSPESLTAMNGVLYFQAGEGNNFRTLWRTDGTADGTYPLRNGHAIDSPSLPQMFSVAGGLLYFICGNTLWKSDGTAGGTVPLNGFGAEPDGFIRPGNLTPAGNRLYLTGSDGFYGTVGKELWTTDGTVAGTVLVKDIVPGTQDGGPYNFAVAGGRLYFSGNDGLHGREPWSTDGTPGGTGPVADIWPGNLATSSDPEGIEFNGQYYFHAQYDSYGTNHPEGIFRTDGTAAGTVMVAGDVYQVDSLTAVGNTLFFRADDRNTLTGDPALWKVTSTSTAATRVGNFLFPNDLTAMGNVLYFTLDDGSHGKEVWRTDGTDAGTFMLKDIQPGSAPSYPSKLFAIGNTLYFSAMDPVLGLALFRSDGTAAGTTALKSIPTPSGGSPAVSGMVNVNGTLFYKVGAWPSFGYDLWKSDGTAAGTVLVRSGLRDVTEMVPVGNSLYFTSDAELWKTDGTTAGTYQVKDIYPGVNGSSPIQLTAVGNLVYFSANDPVNGQRIWQSDGTAAGTFIATPIAATVPGSNGYHQLVAFNDSLYFTGTDGVSGIELFRLIPDTGMVRFSTSLEASEADGVATVTVNRIGGSSGSVSVNYSVSNGTATAGSDFTAVSGTLIFADGQTSRTFTIPLVNDSVGELDETLIVLLSQPAGGVMLGMTSAPLTIHDDDHAQISVADLPVIEGNSGVTNANFTVSLTHAVSTPVTVSYYVFGDTASDAIDIGSNITGTLTIPAGQTSGVITVPVLADTAVEPDETFYLNLYGATGAADITRASAVGTIVNDDVPGTVQFSSATYTATESLGIATITVTRTGGNASFSVYYDTSPGTAAPNSDYNPFSGILRFGPTDTSQTFWISVVKDAVLEPDETFNVRLYNPTGASLGTPSTAVVTIVGDPALSVGDASTTEGNSGTRFLSFPVTLSKTSTKQVTAQWTTVAGTATVGTDFTASSGTITIPAGSTTAFISVPILGDTATEPDETFTVVLSSPVNAAIAKGQATGTIINDDSPGTIGFSSATYTANETGGSAMINLVRTGGSAGSVSVSFTTGDGTATAGADYSAISTTVTFASGETSKAVVVPLINDTHVESDETVNLALSDPTGGAVLGTSAAVLTIHSEDVPDTTAPTVTIVPITPTPRSTPVASVSILFSEPVSGLDLPDLKLSRDGGADLLAETGATLSSSDGGTSWILANLSAITTPVGNYSLVLTAAGSGIVDAAGNSLVTGDSAAFTVTANDPTPTISGVTPNPIVGSALAQNLTIVGQGFASGSVVRLKNLTTGATINSANITSRSATQLVVSQVFGAATANWSVEVLNGAASSGAFNFQVVAPSQLAIGVAPNPVTGKTAALTAVNGGSNTSTVFAWSVTTKPTGATTPTFNRNNSNAAKTATITFFKAGSYTLKLTSTTGSTVKTATLTFTVQQTLTSIAVSPSSGTIFKGTTKQVTATLKDQFSATITGRAITWSVDAGGVGSVSTTGLYTAGPTAGSAKVRATVDTVSAAATITVIATAKINFQKSGTPTVSGYTVDSGSTYAARNGLTYGWSTSHTDTAVDRNKNTNQLLDTNIGIKSGARWDLAVPSGTYQVKLSVGDSSVATTNTIRVEGTSAYSATKLGANVFSNKLVTVTVTDGKLTIDAGTAASLVTRMDYLEITRV